MKTLLFFIFCTFSVLVQAEPKVIIFYEYTADGYALFAANDEEYPVTLEFDFDLLNLKVVRDGPSSIVVPAEANKHKLLDLVAINVLKGYSFEYTFTVKKGAVKANLKDIIAVSDRAALKAKELSKNVDTTDEPVISNANRNPRDLRESRIKRKASSKPVNSSDPVATTNPVEVKLDANNKPIVKTEPTQVAIAKAVKKREREEKRKAEMELAKKRPVAVAKTESSKTVVASSTIEVKELAKKDITPVAKAEPIAKTKPEPVVVPKVENKSSEVAIAEPVKKKRNKKKRSKKKRAKKTPVAVAKTEPVKTVIASTTIEAKKPLEKKVTLEVTSKPIVQAKPEPVKTVVASTTIETEKTAEMEVTSKPISQAKPDPVVKPVVKSTSTEVAIAEPVKKKRVKRKKSKKKPVVVATKPIVTSKPVEKPTPIAIEKTTATQPKIIKPAVTVKTPEEKPVAEVIEPKKEEKIKPTYAVTGKYDAAFQYHLPFSKGATFTISQGYQGAISHQSKFALDFATPLGTAIYSTREGTVLEVIENNSQGCASQDCAKYDNFIVINHPDGSFAKYAHIRMDGAVVAEGDVISVGQLIGYTGNTGWTATPALHFEVFVQKEKEQKTIKTNFLTGDGSDYGILMEQRRYKKEY